MASTQPTRSQTPPVPVASPAELDKAVAAAQVAFEQWSPFPLEDRRKALFAYSDALNAEKDGFTSLLTKEQGKPLSQAAMEVEMAVAWIKGLASLEIPEVVLENSSERKIVQRFTPIGVAAAIVPWNFPVLLAIGKVVSALITGNSIIVKPSPFTPYTALKLTELAIPFVPPGVFQALSGDDQLGPWMTRHPGILKVSFTGSTLTGKRIALAGAETFKQCTLELGGNDPAIICKDVDLDALVPKVGSPLVHGIGGSEPWASRRQVADVGSDQGRSSLLFELQPGMHDDQTALCTREHLRGIPR